MAFPSHAELEQLALEEIAELPDEFRERIRNLGVVIEDDPPEGKAWLATYSGIPLTRQTATRPWGWPNKITIYRNQLMRICGDDPESLAREMRHVIRHEIAHYFGISDERLIEIDRY